MVENVCQWPPVVSNIIYEKNLSKMLYDAILTASTSQGMLVPCRCEPDELARESCEVSVHVPVAPTSPETKTE